MKNLNYTTYRSTEAVGEYSNKNYLRSYEKYIISKYIKEGDLVLDLGCGGGRTTRYLAATGATVTGIDISEPLIENAKSWCPDVKFEVMDAMDLKFPDDFFDVSFFSFNGIDYLDVTNRQKALSEIYRTLKPGGYFIYSTHNGWCVPRSKMARKTLVQNIFNLRPAVHFRMEKHEMGQLLTYYNNIFNEKNIVSKVGFEWVETRGNGKLFKWPLLAIAFLEKFPMFVFRK